MPTRLADARLRLRRLGPELLDDASLLAVALGGGSRGLTRARRLLSEGGGLRGLGRWTVGELVARHAIAETRAAALVAAGELTRRAAAASWPAEDWVVRVPGDVGERLVPMMADLEREELRVLLLNTRNVVQAMVTVYVGNLSGSSVRVAEVFRDAVRALAAGIVVAHNHPSGDPTPSGDDLRITRELTDAGRLLDIAVLDHLVIGRGRWISLRAEGAL